MYDPWQRNCPVKKSCKQNLCFQGTTELCGDEYEKSAWWVICSLIVNKVFFVEIPGGGCEKEDSLPILGL